MKPNLHHIPLTVQERTFLMVILDRAIESNEEHLTQARGIIAVSPARPDGLIDIVLNDNDRECVYDVVNDGEFLDELGVRARISRPYFHFRPPAGYFLKKKAEGRVEGLYIEGYPDAEMSGGAGHTLFQMFAPFEIDRPTVWNEINRHTVGSGNHHGLSGKQRTNLERCLFERCYRLEPIAELRGRQRKYAEFERLAFQVCEVAGFGTLRVDPKSRAGKRRIHIDWHDWMWLPPKPRRLPLQKSPRLPAADEEALKFLST